MKVLGRSLMLSDNRLVWMGVPEDHPDAVFISLRNREGQWSQLMLSEDAMFAIISLFNVRFADNRSTEWQKNIPCDSADGPVGTVAHEDKGDGKPQT